MSDVEFLTAQDVDTLGQSFVLPKPKSANLDSIVDRFGKVKEIPQRSGRSQSDESGVKYGSADSSHLDMSTQRLFLYGKAYVRYEDFEVTSDYIIFDFNSNEVEALKKDLAVDRPTFKTGGQTVTADRIRYNIDTKKGIVYGARVKQGELYIHGAITKFVKAGSDSIHIDDVIYNRNALITTCDRQQPHWGIRTSKLKMIPDKIAVIGPSIMEIAGIPIPLVLPFAFAPLFKFNQGVSGIIFPQDPFYRSPNLGLGIRGLGYYFRFSEYMDLSLRGDIYTRGSWGITANTNYRRRYKYSGTVNLSFSRQISEIRGQLEPNIQNSYSISINHNQDSKAHPYRRIGGTLRFTVNDFDRRNFSDAQSQLNSQINSNFSYSYQFSKDLQFSAAVNHSQNTLNRSINFTLPNLQLRLNRIFPFKKGRSSGTNEKWFEKVSFQYIGKFQNTVSTVDTLLFTKQTLEAFRAGFSHEIVAGASYNLFNNFNFNANVDYDEFWYLQTHELENDTLGNTVSTIIPNFKPYRDLAVSGGLTTNLFGTVLFKKGLLRGLRHEMTPTIGLSFSPSTEKYYKFFDGVEDVYVDELDRFNPFVAQGGEKLFRNTSLDAGGASITYSLRNRLRGKYWSRKDSTVKKFELFTANFSGSYNFQSDSLKWSTISMTATSRLFGGITTISLNGTFDPYVKDGVRRINKTVWSESKRPFRLERLSGGVSTTLTLGQIRDFLKGEDADLSTRGASRSRNRSQNQNEYPELFSWFKNFRIQHTYRFSIRDNQGDKEFNTTTHSIRLTTGNIPLSDKWGMGIGNLSYDFKRKSFVYPSFNLTRDLHCWQMRISWQPQADTYSFFIGVKASPFSQFLKYETGRTQFDASFR